MPEVMVVDAGYYDHITYLISTMHTLMLVTDLGSGTMLRRHPQKSWSYLQIGLQSLLSTGQLPLQPGKSRLQAFQAPFCLLQLQFLSRLGSLRFLQ